MYKGKKYNIFICYRGREDRQGGLAGQLLFNKLKGMEDSAGNKSYKPFYANAVLKEGVDNFKDASRQALEDVKVFILLLTPEFFDKCFNYDDMVKDEIQTALNNAHIQFIPIALPGFNAEQEITEDVCKLFLGDFADRVMHMSPIEWHNPGKFDIENNLKKAIDEGFKAYDEAKNSKQSSVAEQSYSNDDQGSPCIYYAHREWLYKDSKSEFGAKVKKALIPVVDFAEMWVLPALPVVLALIALITLLVCFCGVRGIYVNVDDPNEFYSFDATRYEYHGTLLGEDYVEKGTWKADDGQLKLTHKGADGEKVTEAYYFDTLDSKKRISVSSEFGVKKEFKRVSLLAYSTPQKIKITFDGNGGSQGAYIPVEGGMEPFAGGTQKVDIGSKLKELADPVRDGYRFMGWYTMPDGWKTGMGEQFFFEDCVWEKATYYANWKNTSTFILTGGGLESPVVFTEGDDILAAYMQAMGWDSLPAGVTGLIFRVSNGNKIVATCAPAANVSVTVVRDYLIENGVLKYVNPELEKFVIPDSVTSIGDYAFRDCKSLTSVTIPDSVTSIGERAFAWCGSLQYNEYGNALYLGNDENPYVVLIKAKNKSITSVNIYDATKIIYQSAFSGCDSLTSATIPDSVTSIGSYAFSGCDSLTSVTIPDSVTSIGSYAFYSCDSLTSVTIPDSVTSIEDSAFAWCTSLTSVTIPESVTSIGDSAFYNCDSLTSIVIPDSVTSIGGRAFAWCTSLTSVTFEGTKAEWNAVYKGSSWKDNCPFTDVKCSDGVVPV